MIVFSIDTLFKEPFTYTQLFNYREFSFFTNRGLMTTFSLAFAVASTCSILLSLVGEHNLVRDHTFTLAFFHFCIVCLTMLDFPTSYEWWIALVVGSITLDGICEFILHQFNTMPYKSHMAGDQKRNDTKKVISSNIRLSSSASIRKGKEAIDEQDVRHVNDEVLQDIDDERMHAKYRSPRSIIDISMIVKDPNGSTIKQKNNWIGYDDTEKLVKLDEILIEQQGEIITKF